MNSILNSEVGNDLIFRTRAFSKAETYERAKFFALILALTLLTFPSLCQGLADPPDPQSSEVRYFLPRDSTMFLQDFELLKEYQKVGYLNYRLVNYDSSIIQLISVKVCFDTIKLDSDLFNFSIPILISTGDSIDVLSSSIRSDEVFENILYGSLLSKTPAVVWLIIGIVLIFAGIGLFNKTPAVVWLIIGFVLVLAGIGIFMLIF